MRSCSVEAALAAPSRAARPRPWASGRCCRCRRPGSSASSTQPSPPTAISRSRSASARRASARRARTRGCAPLRASPSRACGCAASSCFSPSASNFASSCAAALRLLRAVRVVDAVDQVLDALGDALGLDAVCEVERHLLRAPAVGLADGGLHRVGHLVGVEHRLAVDVARRAADGLDERARRSAGTLPCRRRGSPPARPRAGRGPRAAG